MGTGDLRRSEPNRIEVTIGMVGKYTELPDAYKSVNEALKHMRSEEPSERDHQIRRFTRR